jgi:hypothetical protein
MGRRGEDMRRGRENVRKRDTKSHLHVVTELIGIK